MECDETSPSTATTASGLVLPVPVNKIGGKRRSPDIDTVAEQLSHLSSSAESMFQQQRNITTPKRHCGEGGLPGSVLIQQHPPLPPTAGTSTSSVEWTSSQPMEVSQASPAFDPLILDLPVSNLLLNLWNLLTRA